MLHIHIGKLYNNFQVGHSSKVPTCGDTTYVRKYINLNLNINLNLKVNLKTKLYIKICLYMFSAIHKYIYICKHNKNILVYFNKGLSIGQKLHVRCDSFTAVWIIAATYQFRGGFEPPVFNRS